MTVSFTVLLDEKPPEAMVAFLLLKHNHDLNSAVKEARENMGYYKVCLDKKMYWCEVIHKLESRT